MPVTDFPRFVFCLQRLVSYLNMQYVLEMFPTFHLKKNVKLLKPLKTHWNHPVSYSLSLGARAHTHTQYVQSKMSDANALCCELRFLLELKIQNIHLLCWRTYILKNVCLLACAPACNIISSQLFRMFTVFARVRTHTRFHRIYKFSSSCFILAVYDKVSMLTKRIHRNMCIDHWFYYEYACMCGRVRARVRRGEGMILIVLKGCCREAQGVHPRPLIDRGGNGYSLPPYLAVALLSQDAAKNTCGPTTWESLS